LARAKRGSPQETIEIEGSQCSLFRFSLIEQNFSTIYF
jgi:hypothetical protein